MPAPEILDKRNIKQLYVFTEETVQYNMSIRSTGRKSETYRTLAFNTDAYTMSAKLPRGMAPSIEFVDGEQQPIGTLMSEQVVRVRLVLEGLEGEITFKESGKILWAGKSLRVNIRGSLTIKRFEDPSSEPKPDSSGVDWVVHVDEQSKIVVEAPDADDTVRKALEDLMPKYWSIFAGYKLLYLARCTFRKGQTPTMQFHVIPPSTDAGERQLLVATDEASAEVLQNNWLPTRNGGDDANTSKYVSAALWYSYNELQDTSFQKLLVTLIESCRNLSMFNPPESKWDDPNLVQRIEVLDPRLNNAPFGVWTGIWPRALKWQNLSTDMSMEVTLGWPPVNLHQDAFVCRFAISEHWMDDGSGIAPSIEEWRSLQADCQLMPSSVSQEGAVAFANPVCNLHDPTASIHSPSPSDDMHSSSDWPGKSNAPYDISLLLF